MARSTEASPRKRYPKRKKPSFEVTQDLGDTGGDLDIRIGYNEALQNIYNLVLDIKPNPTSTTKSIKRLISEYVLRERYE